MKTHKMQLKVFVDSIVGTQFVFILIQCLDWTIEWIASHSEDDHALDVSIFFGYQISQCYGPVSIFDIVDINCFAWDY